MKYGPLKEYLSGLRKDKTDVTLRFAEIEKIIGAELPRSASDHRAWWGNHTGNFQARAWLDAGFLVDGVNVGRKTVHFQRGLKPTARGPKRVSQSVLKAKESLSVTRLIDAGFQKCGYWEPKRQGGIGFAGDIPKEPGIYAYAIDGKVQYIGVAAMGLKKRIYFYGKPGPTQRTNIRLNGLITKELEAGKVVELLAAKPGQTTWNGFPVDLSAGLESAIIKRFKLPWNVRGVAG